MFTDEKTLRPEGASWLAVRVREFKLHRRNKQRILRIDFGARFVFPSSTANVFRCGTAANDAASVQRNAIDMNLEDIGVKHSVHLSNTTRQKDKE